MERARTLTKIMDRVQMEMISFILYRRVIFIIFIK